MSDVIFIARGDLLSTPFRDAMVKIATCNVLDIQLAYNLQRFMKELEKTISETHKAWIELVKQYVNVKLDGNFEATEAGTFKWKDGVDADAAIKAIQTFGNFKTRVLRRPLTLDSLRNCGLSPSDIAALGEIIESPDVEKQA